MGPQGSAKINRSMKDRKTCTHTIEQSCLRADECAQCLRERNWQPIETAPKSTEVLVCGWCDNKPGNGYWMATATCVDGRWLSDPESSDNWYYPPTHWMSLPQPPKPVEPSVITDPS